MVLGHLPFDVQQKRTDLTRRSHTTLIPESTIYLLRPEWDGYFRRYSYALPLFDYGYVIWGGRGNYTLMGDLQVVHTKAERII